MPPNPACKTFIPLLSAFIDGELPPPERVQVERHLSVCTACMGRTADLRAESGLIRVGLEMAADEADFKDFAQKVMARITPEKPPLLERLRLSFGELFTYHRGVMISSMVTAAVVALVAVPLTLMNSGAPEGYASDRMTVQTVKTDETAKVAPVVMETENGNAIIWLVDHPVDTAPEAGPPPEAQAVEHDEAHSEELEMEPTQPSGPGTTPNGGEL